MSLECLSLQQVGVGDFLAAHICQEHGAYMGVSSPVACGRADACGIGSGSADNLGCSPAVNHEQTSLRCLRPEQCCSGLRTGSCKTCLLGCLDTTKHACTFWL